MNFQKYFMIKEPMYKQNKTKENMKLISTPYKKYGIVHAKKFLNHTDIKTTMHYLNVEDDTEVLIDAL